MALYFRPWTTRAASASQRLKSSESRDHSVFKSAFTGSHGFEQLELHEAWLLRRHVEAPIHRHIAIRI